MKAINVPLYKNEPAKGAPEGVHCVQHSLRMVLEYLSPGDKVSLEDAEKITGFKEEKATWEMTGLLWLVENGYELKRYCAFDYDEFAETGVGYLEEQYGKEAAEWQVANSDMVEAQSLSRGFSEKVTIIKREPTTEDIIMDFKQDYIVQVGLDSGVLNETGEYCGHSVVVIGYDDGNIYINDPGLPAYKNRKVPKKKLQEAMDSFGGEMDSIKVAASND